MGAERAAWHRLARGKLLPAKRLVEALPQTAGGAFVVGPRETPSGMILVERNRICWTAASGMRQRLRDLLRTHCSTPIGEDALEATHAQCRVDGRPLGETLVNEGLVTAAQMRAAMKQHTAESLLALDAAYSDDDSGEWPFTWVDRSGRGYNPRYRFTGAEVLAAVGARSIASGIAEVVADHLQTLDDTGGSAVAFFVDADGHQLFIGAQTTLWLSVEDLVDLAT